MELSEDTVSGKLRIDGIHIDAYGSIQCTANRGFIRIGEPLQLTDVSFSIQQDDLSTEFVYRLLRTKSVTVTIKLDEPA